MNSKWLPLLILSLIVAAPSAFAEASLFATCSGFINPNNQAVSFRLIRDPDSTGQSPSVIDIYVKDLSKPNSPNNYLGKEICTSETTKNLVTTCVTSMHETYVIDLATKTGEENGPGYSYKYPSCTRN